MHGRNFVVKCEGTAWCETGLPDWLFLTPNFTKLAFLEAVGVKKLFVFFCFFFSIFGVLWRLLTHTLD